MREQIDSITDELFSRNAVEVLDDGDATDALYDALVEKANIAISEYGWDAVFESWCGYINCMKPILKYLANHLNEGSYDKR